MKLVQSSELINFKIDRIDYSLITGWDVITDSTLIRFGKDISKKEQQSDWGNPNLSSKQISYAAQDTEYLFEIKDKLIKMLIREKRMDLFNKCMKVIPVMVDMEISGYKLSTFEH